MKFDKKKFRKLVDKHAKVLKSTENSQERLMDDSANGSLAKILGKTKELMKGVSTFKSEKKLFGVIKIKNKEREIVSTLENIETLRYVRLELEESYKEGLIHVENLKAVLDEVGVAKESLVKCIDETRNIIADLLSEYDEAVKKDNLNEARLLALELKKYESLMESLGSSMLMYDATEFEADLQIAGWNVMYNEISKMDRRLEILIDMEEKNLRNPLPMLQATIAISKARQAIEKSEKKQAEDLEEGKRLGVEGVTIVEETTSKIGELKEKIEKSQEKIKSIFKKK